ncbi:MAG: hypothetical protein JW807_16175 [Spirochaetes bacterium]|nr:hypothetical protein [Spirochaetota bacterium]
MSVHQHSQELINALRNSADSGNLACAVAFKIAAEHKASPAEIGKAMDIEDLNIVKCQLGLFGYKPEKKIVRPAESVSDELKAEITAGLTDGKLSCDQAWTISKKLHISKMDVAAACDTLGVKIKSCQLGAF